MPVLSVQAVFGGRYSNMADAIRLYFFGLEKRIQFWKDVSSYSATEGGESVFVRHQKHRFLPWKHRRVIYRSPSE